MSGNDEHALYHRFLRGLEISPDGTALRLGGVPALSYRQAHDLALTWAGALCAADAPPRAVGVLAGKTVPAYAGLLAGLYTGATVVPLNPDFPAERTRRMLELAGVQALIVDERGATALAALGDDGARQEGGASAVPALRTVLAARDDGTVRGDLPGGRSPVEVSAGSALGAPRPVTREDTAYMLFTSGSTGSPKGVPISHGSAHHYFRLLDERYDFTARDVFSQTFDLNFDCAMFDLFGAWGAGATVATIPPHSYRRLPDHLREQGITVWFSTPSAISLVRRTGQLTAGALPTLRWSLFAGEALHCRDAADWHAAASGSLLENIYGPTELTITITGHRWDPVTSARHGVNGLVPIGSVHPGHDHLLLSDDGSTVGDEGELCVTGPQMTVGYLDPREDEGRFLEHDGRRWYRTGDRVRRLPDSDELLYLGRLDSQVQIQGWRVELAEIDQAVRLCPGVEDALTVARQVEGGTELLVFYTGERTPAVTLARSLREVLPAGMLPRHFEHLGSFPLNSNRKVDRKALATRADALLGS
ncbi:AMP-binding protein [Streptomyces tendae]|uniref:AMP-binding protein n=1 Tax=Streptomyces tendae TaxID=1932 RepID=UPI003673A117